MLLLVVSAEFRSVWGSKDAQLTFVLQRDIRFPWVLRLIVPDHGISSRKLLLAFRTRPCVFFLAGGCSGLVVSWNA